MRKQTYIAPQDMTENCILIDWLTVTLHGFTVREVQLLLGLDPEKFTWTEMRVFRNGYPMQTMFNNISIRWGADRAEYYTSDDKKSAAEKVRLDMGICLDMSGHGCRAYEEYGNGDWYMLLASLCHQDRKINFTRLDLAFDDHTGILDMNRMRCDLEDRNYVFKGKKTRLIWSDDLKEDIQGLTLQIGSEKSPVLIRIYNKAAERGFNHELHWIRVELQLRDTRALVAVAKLIQHEDVGKVFSGIVRNYFTFRIPGDDTNKSRWPIVGYWLDMIGDMEKISLWISPGEPYNFSKTERALIAQYGQSIICIFRIHKDLTSLVAACERAHPELAPKYEAVIAEAERKREELRRKRREHNKKTNEVRQYYGFEVIPEDDPAYKESVFDLLCSDVLYDDNVGNCLSGLCRG